jgi:PEP-CTERM motif
MFNTLRPLLLAALIGCSAAAIADTTVYSFAGNYSTAGGTQSYFGTFSTVDPMQTLVRPFQAPDVTSPTYNGIWAGTSQFYTGGTDLSITFASGTIVSASGFGIVVNNTTLQGNGAPYPMGLSVQLYPSALLISPPTANVCATPTGACGEDDDPLYHDATQDAIMAIQSVYFAFYNAPLATMPGMPNLVDAFGLSGGLGVTTTPPGVVSSTTLTSFNQFSANVFPSPAPGPGPLNPPPSNSVPEPGTWTLLLAGLLAALGASRRARPPTTA